MPREEFPLAWPFGGIVEVTSFADQPQGTTFDTLNVRPHDSIASRKRGGQRAGLSKYFALAVNGSSRIQQISSVTLAFDPALVNPDTVLASDDFTAYGSTGILNTLNPTDWPIDGSNSTSTDFTGTQPAVSGQELQVLDVDGGRVLAGGTSTAGATDTGGVLFRQLTLGSSFVVDADMKAFRKNSSDILGAILIEGRVGAVERASIQWLSTTTIDEYTIEVRNLIGNVLLDSITAVPITGSGTYSDSFNLEVRVSGSNLFVFLDGSQQLGPVDISSLGASAEHLVGLGIEKLGTDHGIIVDNFQVRSAILPASLRETRLLIASGGNLYDALPGGSTALLIGGSGALDSVSQSVWLEQAFSNAYTMDGTSSGYNLINPTTRTVSDWQTAVTGGSLPVGGLGTSYSITAVNTGSKQFTVAEDLSAILSASDFIEVRTSTGNDGAYTVASTSGSGPTVITVDQTIPDATVDGSLVKGSVGCRFAALYRGRLVLAGLASDPQNWFMSASGNPLDWDYFPATVSETQAVAGNNNQAGKVEDIITALMPYLDDVLYFGGDHTLWAMQGDPASNGRIDNVSRQIGVVGPEAWTFDTSGNLYFMGQNGLYKLTGGTTSLELLTRGKLDDTFSQLDFAANRIRLIYDRETQGIHIFITPQDEPVAVTDHYFWDERTNSFWRDQYPTAHGPTAVHLFDADSFDDRAILLGGFDSFIRTFERTSKTDDGTTIHSFVNFSPLDLDSRTLLRSSETTILLSQTSDSSAVLQIYAADNAEDVSSETSPKAAKTLSEGRNTPLIKRVGANSLLLRIDNNTNDTTWAYESGSIIIEGEGIVRREETK